MHFGISDLHINGTTFTMISGLHFRKVGETSKDLATDSSKFLFLKFVKFVLTRDIQGFE